MNSVSLTGNAILMTHVLILLLAVTQPYVTACGGNLTDLKGTIQSPGYPGNYSDDLDCVWFISAPAGYRVTVTFQMFNLQPAQNETCQKSDHVQIQDGGAEDSPSLGVHCGSDVPARRRTFSNVMRFRFTADGDLTATGFLVSYVSEILPNNFILLPESYSHRIIRLDVGTISNYPIPMEGVFGPFAVDYDPLEDRIYWTDIDIKEIRTAFLNGTGSQTVRILEANTMPYGLALDPLSRLIFYTDTGSDVIGMVSMSGSAHKTVISTALQEPRAIALDTDNGVMYWTDVGVKPKLERANYDGSGRRVLVSLALSSPNSIAIDFKLRRLYWVDAGTGSVERCDLDGRSRRSLSQFAPRQFYGLALYGDQLYLTDWGLFGDKTNTSSILIINASGGNAIIHGTAPGRMNEIHLHAQDSWQRGPNGCSANPKACKYFCAPTERNFICLYPDAVAASTSELPESAIIALIAGGGGVLLVIIAVVVVVVRKRRRERAAMRNLEPVVNHAAASCYSLPLSPYAVHNQDFNEHVYDELCGETSLSGTSEPPEDYITHFSGSGLAQRRSQEA